MEDASNPELIAISTGRKLVQVPKGHSLTLNYCSDKPNASNCGPVAAPARSLQLGRGLQRNVRQPARPPLSNVSVLVNKGSRQRVFTLTRKLSEEATERVRGWIPTSHRVVTVNLRAICQRALRYIACYKRSWRVTFIAYRSAQRVYIFLAVTYGRRRFQGRLPLDHASGFATRS